MILCLCSEERFREGEVMVEVMSQSNSQEKLLTVMPVAPGNSEDVKKALLNLEMDTPSLVDEKAAAFKDYLSLIHI